MPLFLQRALNVINGEVLFASLDDVVPDRIGFGGLLRAFGGREEKRPGRVFSEVVNQHAETAFGVAEALGRVFGGEFIDKESA
jgi:hypothetical protein